MFSIDDAGDGHPADRKCTEYTGALSPASFRWHPFAASHVGYTAK